MRILFCDRVQNSYAPAEAKSPALSEAGGPPAIITFDCPYPIDSIGLGNSDASYFDISFNDAKNTAFRIDYQGNGLYCMKGQVEASQMAISTDASFIGRIAAGIGAIIPTAIAKEPGYGSTSEPRVTLSGQVIPGAGGYNFRTLSLDSRYKIGPEAMAEIEAGYREIGLGFPFFIDLSSESYKLPFARLYATEQNQRNLSFESGVPRFLYSRRWQFREAF